MKQEQRLVAEVYRYLAPFVDTSKDVFVSLDGQAAITGVKQGRLKDSTIPDLWFTIVGAKAPLFIEAKAFNISGQVFLMQNQLKSWRSNGLGNYKPNCWIAVSNAFDAFYLWEHTDFVSALDKSKSKQKTVSITGPKTRREFKTVSELSLAILCRAQQDAPADVSVAASRRQRRG